MVHSQPKIEAATLARAADDAQERLVDGGRAAERLALPARWSKEPLRPRRCRLNGEGERGTFDRDDAILEGSGADDSTAEGPRVEELGQAQGQAHPGGRIGVGKTALEGTRRAEAERGENEVRFVAAEHQAGRPAPAVDSSACTDAKERTLDQERAPGGE
ncbi:MAG: hypothetical protein AB7K52_07500 [Phycisphaerales bacterium]